MKQTTKSLKTKILLTLLFISFVAFTLFFVNSSFKANKVLAVEVDAEISNEYVLGDTVNLPQATLAYQSQDIPATRSLVIFPDGTATTSTKFVLDGYGEYTVKYYADVDNFTLVGEKKIKIQDEYCTSTDDTSSYYYGSNDAYQVSGLNLSIKVGAEMKINKIIDLNGLSYDDGSFIDFMFTPSTLGVTDAYEVFMKLTDAYDSDNYVIVRMVNWSDQGSWADGVAYLDARATGQVFTSAVTTEENYHKRWSASRPGWYMANISMTGVDSAKPVYEKFRFMYDDANKSMVTSANAKSPANLVELANAKWYDLETEKLWNGFTTGECYVSFYGERYTSGSLNLCVTKLLGVDLKQMENEDVTAPIVTVDYAGENDASLPYAIVNEPYSVYDATAIDTVDGEINVISNVYYNYDSNKCLIDVTDGSFTPDKTGTYTIIYFAKDKLGNVTKERVDINCVEKPANSLSVSSTGKTTSGITGVEIKLLNDVTVSNANGLNSYEIFVESESGDKIAVGDDFTFVPIYNGTYKVNVVAKDYVLTESEIFDLVITDNDEPVFLENAELPRYFIKGASYSVENLTAKLLTNKTSSDVVSSLYVSENGGQEVLCDGVYTPSAAGKTTLTFKAANGSKIGTASYVVDVIDVGYGIKNGLKLTNYFYDANGKMSVVSTDDYFTISTTQDTSIDFVNMLQAVSFTAKFNIDASKKNFSKINFYLTDSVDESIKLKVSYSIGEGVTLFNLNDSSFSKSIAVDTDNSSGLRLWLNYNNSTKKLSGSSDVSWTVAKDVNGNDFNGFPSKKIYLTCEFEGVTGDAGIILYSINNQSFYTMKKDEYKPEIFTNTTVGTANVGTLITISPADYFDVLDPTVTPSFSVKDPNGNYVVTTDNTVLNGSCDPYKEYSFIASVYGDYMISYQCQDTVNKPISYEPGFSVVDLVAPVVTFINPVTSANVGQTITLANVNVSDNKDSASNITVQYYIRIPGIARFEQVAQNKQVKLEKKGVYTVFVYAYDLNRNTTIVSYDIVVN